MRYSDGQWRVIDRGDRLKLCKTEGQVWLTLYQLLMDKDCQQKYEFNSHNKAVILKVHAHAIVASSPGASIFFSRVH